MKISGNRKSLFFHLFAFFMIAVLLLNMPVYSVYAAENNPEGNTISFPKIENPDDKYMDTNNGTISTLLATGTVETNYGTIETSNGTVTKNRGTIKKLLSGNVGTNYGTIDEINGTGTLGENDDSGTVTLNNGNTITRNDGKIVNNYGTVLENYHEIENNYGKVTMYIGSSVTNNNSLGVVTFKGNGTVASNNGTIVIDGASVTVNNNTGTIKLLDNATLTCTNNYGSIVKENDIATYKCTCTNNYGTIGFSNNSDESWSYVSQYYKIVFAGDDSKAELTLYEASNAGNRYTKKGSAVEFILPDEYACNLGKNLGDCGTEGKSKWYVLTDNVDEERKEFTIVCHLCSADSYSYDADKHWQSCSECSRQLSVSAHSFGDYVSNNDATCMVDGTKTRVCTICRYAETVADVDSHLTSDKHNIVVDPRVEATETRTGLTEGSHCADCHKVLVAQSVIPKLPHECVSYSDYSYNADIHWRNCLVCGNRNYEGAHVFGSFTQNNDATCTKDGTKTHSCTVCGYKETVIDFDSHLKSDKHSPVKDPGVAATEIQTGLTEGSHCADCHKVLVAQSVIPKLPHKCVSYSDYSYNADIHWRNCLVCGNRNYEGAHVFGSFTQNNDATCTKDGTKTHSCTVCAFKETVADVDSHLTSDKHNIVVDSRVEATETRTGLTEGLHCADCGKVFVAQEIIPMKESSGTVALDSKDSEPKDTENTPISDDAKTDDAPVSDDIVASDNTPAPNDKFDVFLETGDDASNTDEAASGKESEKKTTNVVPIVVVSSSVVVIGSLVTVWGLKRRKRFKK